jgi:hypothetical protein
MLDINKVKEDLKKIWERYQFLLDNAKTEEEITEARVYIYFLGNFYAETFGKEAIEYRLKNLHLTPLEFYMMVDKNSPKLKEYRKIDLFNKLERLYRLIKSYKMKEVNGSYLDENKFNEKYTKIMYGTKLKMYKGRKV